MKKYKGELLMLITALMWGSGFVGMAAGLEHWTVFQLMAGRFLAASIILSIIFYKKLKLISKSVLWKGAVLGTILFTAFALQTMGLEYTTPSKNAFLTAINVIIVPIIAYVIYKRRIDRFEFIAAGVAIIGIGFLSLQDSLTINVGDILSIICAVGFAFDIFYTNVFVKTEDALALTIVQFYTATILSVIAVLILDQVPTTYSTEGIAIIIYLAIFCTAIAYVCQNIGMQYANPTKSAIILSMESLFGTIFSVLLLNEILTERMILGCILIFLAIIFAEVKPTFKRKKSYI
ncbi:EamA family transporter [Lysinibacillus sp. 2017]|uniref:DMT family transporter n=1 Tax=unclassified Lysinibacillus TaxID=2636778 RepID=UPI000D528A94|nr:MULTISPECIES: DMT family transporter [unclassified Lysinibacillus]AWE07540.1 EamA family transporter [Lysinibacillus sp. 2017]TGN36703.1 DMT family transporter [Lysinibacillus sp. S2017]